MDKKELAILLSKLNNLVKYDYSLEQYPLESEDAASILWLALLNQDIEGKIIADLGTGEGILGLGALLLGAKKVFFIDISKDAIKIARNNYENLLTKFEIGSAEFLNIDVNDFKEKVDMVIQNPPFGTVKKHIDIKFLQKAFNTANTVYSIHKTSTKNFIMKLAKINQFRVQSLDFNFKIKKIMKQHKKPKVFIETTLFILKK